MITLMLLSEFSGANANVLLVSMLQDIKNSSRALIMNIPNIASSGTHRIS